MAMFNSYVSLPEGTHFEGFVTPASGGTLALLSILEAHIRVSNGPSKSIKQLPVKTCNFLGEP